MKNVVLICTVLAFFSGGIALHAQDTDADGIPDDYETFFGLDPNDPADAQLDPDLDGWNNLQEFSAFTDPNAEDTDLDGTFDSVDPEALDAAVIHWARTDLQAGANAMDYVWPTWMLGATQIGGTWGNNQWIVPASAPAGLQALDMEIDPTGFHDLQLSLGYTDFAGSSLHVSLLDASQATLAVDLFGNLIQGTGGDVVRELLIPIASYPSAAHIRIHRSAGQAAVSFSRLAPTGDPVDLAGAGPNLPDYTPFVYCDSNGPFYRFIANDATNQPPFLDYDQSFQVYVTAGPLLDCRRDSDLDGLPNDWEILQGSSPLVADCVETFGEAGQFMVAQADPNSWHTLNFNRSYENPVVIMRTVSANDPDPCFVRVRNASTYGCEFQLQEWDYQDGVHGPESIHYLVLEAGVHVLPDGSLIEAGIFDKARHSYKSVEFAGAFPTAPVLVSQVMSESEPEACLSRQRNIDALGFQVKLQEEQASVKPQSGHAHELVGYIAAEPGSRSVFGRLVDAGSSPTKVKHRPVSLSHPQPFSRTRVLLADFATSNVGDPASPRVTSTDASGFTLFAQEEVSYDAETNHGAEYANWLAIEPGLLIGSFLTSGLVDSDCDDLPDNWEISYFGDTSYGPDDDPDGDGFSNIVEFDHATDPGSVTDACSNPLGEVGLVSVSSGAPAQVTLRHTYIDPVVIAHTLTSFDPEPAMVDASISGGTLTLEIAEFLYQNQNHGEELLSYMVVEAGRHLLLDGRVIEAGSTTVGAGTTKVTYAEAFSAPPVVLAQIHNPIDPEPAFLRIFGNGKGSIKFSQLEPEAPLVIGQATETVHYIAMEEGLAATTDGPIQVGRTGKTVTHLPEAIALPVGLSSRPAFFANILQFGAGDPATIRLGQINTLRAEVYVAEEQSGDQETAHGTRYVGWAAIAAGSIYNDNAVPCPPNPPFADSDGDGLFNDLEAVYGTDPNLADTDGDGMSDTSEIIYGSDPTNASSIATASSFPLEIFRPDRAGNP